MKNAISDLGLADVFTGYPHLYINHMYINHTTSTLDLKKGIKDVVRFFDFLCINRYYVVTTFYLAARSLSFSFQTIHNKYINT